MKQETRSEARERLVSTAARLFYTKGIPNVGINEVIQAAGVARRTLYHHFQSKEELVIAVMQRLQERTRHVIEKAVADAPDAGTALLAIFDSAEELVRHRGFRGCATINAALEMAASSAQVDAAARRQKQWLRELMARLAAEGGAEEPGQLAWQCLLLWDGALVECYINRSAEPLRLARQAAASLLAQPVTSARFSHPPAR